MREWGGMIGKLKYINVFFEKEGPSGTDNQNRKGFFDKGVAAISGAYNIVTDSEARDLALKTRDAINEAEKSTNPVVQKTLELLIATGTIQMGMMDRARVIARFSEGSGKSGARAILDAFENAKKGNITIVLFANNQYSPMDMASYENLIKSHPHQLNTGVSKGLWELYEKKSNLGFGKETWSNISVFCADKGWRTNIIGGNEQIKGKIQSLYVERKIQEEKKIEGILNTEFANIEKSNPLLLSALKKHTLTYDEKGNIDIEEFIKKINVISINEVPGKFEQLALDLRNDAKQMEKKAKELFGSIKAKSAKEIGISGLDERLSRLPFIAYTQSDTIKIVEEVQRMRQTLPETDPKKTELDKLIVGLTSLHTSIKFKIDASNANTVSKQFQRIITKAKQQGKEPTNESIIEEVKSEKNQKEIEFSKKFSEKRDQSERTKSVLEEYDITTYDAAQKKLEELESKQDLTEEEKDLVILLKDYQKSKNSEAQLYVSSMKEFGEEGAKDLFTETNRFTSGNPSEEYNFSAIEKIGIISDPESSDEVKNLYNLDEKDPPLKLSMDNDFSSSPNIGSTALYAVSAGEGLVYLSDKVGKPILDVKLKPYQVESVKKEVLIFQSVGLDKLIPIIPRMNTLIPGSYRVNGLDGDLSDGETNRLLGTLEKIVSQPNDNIIMGSIPERIAHMRSRATSIGQLPIEYYDSILKAKGILNKDDGIGIRYEALREITNPESPTS